MTRTDPSYADNALKEDLPARLKPVSKKTYSRRRRSKTMRSPRSLPIAATGRGEGGHRFAEEEEEEGEGGGHLICDRGAIAKKMSVCMHFSSIHYIGCRGFD